MFRTIKPLSFAIALVASLPLVPASAQYARALTDVAPRSVTGIRFRFVADGPVRGGFGLAGQRLLFGTETGSLYAVDEKTGRQIWRRTIGSPVLSTPAILGNRAYFTTWDNALHSVDLASGRQVWRRDLGRTAGPNDYWEYYVSSPVLDGGRLYVGSGSGSLFAIDPASGKTLWSADAGARVRTTPLVTGGKVIVGTMSGHIIALDRESGRQLWKFATVGAAQDFSFKHNDTRSVVTQPIAVGDVVIAGGRDGNIYGIDLRNGHERWHETHDGGSWILGLASDPATFYSGSGSALIVQASDSVTGKEIWRVPTGNAWFGGIAKAGGVIVSNGSTGVVFGYDARNGAQLWRIRQGDMSLSSPLVAPGVVFTGADDGVVTAINTSPAPEPKLDRYVFSFTDEPPASAFWFAPEALGSIRSAFSKAGFSALGNAELGRTLVEPVSERGRTIVAIADSRLPPDIDGGKLRQFLDGGGVIVLLGPDPLIYGFGAKGEPQSINEQKAKSAFGIDPPNKERDNGFNVATFNRDAANLGLTGQLVIGPAGTPAWAQPSQVSTVLASDRSGMAIAWIKRFANGGLLINLPVPRNRTIDLAPYIDAIDLAVTRYSGEQR